MAFDAVVCKYVVTENRHLRYPESKWVVCRGKGRCLAKIEIINREYYHVFNRELGLVSAVLLVFLAGCASSGGVEEASEVEAPETSAECKRS